MKPYLCQICLLLILPFSLIARSNITFELRSGAFFFSSSTIREIYGTTTGYYELEGEFKFAECFEDWVNVSWFAVDGKIKDTNESTRFNLANFSLGIRYVHSFTKKFSTYLGLGPVIGRFWANHSFSGRNRNIETTGYGGVLKSGLMYCFSDFAFVDFYIDYYYQPAHFKKRIDIGGLRTGVGIGMSF